MPCAQRQFAQSVFFWRLYSSYPALFRVRWAGKSLNQQAKNEAQSDNAEYAHVELLKLEKLPDGTKTQNPVPGAAFFLFYRGRRTTRRTVRHRQRRKNLRPPGAGRILF
ncbi:MAG: hypothetical protein ACLR23_05630 [Clostridia bacterium]